MSDNPSNYDEAPRVPIEYAGKWIAWSHDGTQIVASGNSYTEARQAAVAAGEEDPLLDKAPSANVRFIGGLA